MEPLICSMHTNLIIDEEEMVSAILELVLAGFFTIHFDIVKINKII